MSLQTALTEREVRRSFALSLFNGASFRFAERLIDPPLVLAWFVNQLTHSNFLIGLVAPLGQAAWLLPQIFVSARIQRVPFKMPSYRLAAVIRTVCWMLLAAVVWMLDDPPLLLLSFFFLYALARLASGLGGLAFFDVLAKTIPARRRGSLFAWRQLLGGILGLGAGSVVTLILSHPPLSFPRGHAVLFFLYWAVMFPGMVAFILIREPPGAIISESVTVGQQLRRAGGLVRDDGVFRRFMAVRLAMGLGSVALPFYGILAKNVLGAPDEFVGVYITVRAGAQLFFNLPWGRLSDRHGNRLVFQLVTLGRGATALMAVALVGVVSLFQLRGSYLPYLVLPLFFLDGAVQPAQMLIGSNYLIEIVPDAERPLYLGLANTLFGVVILVSGAGGLVVDLLGFASLFILASVLYLLAYAWTKGLPEPRSVSR
jgi:MFS family permease